MLSFSIRKSEAIIASSFFCYLIHTAGAGDKVENFQGRRGKHGIDMKLQPGIPFFLSSGAEAQVAMEQAGSIQSTVDPLVFLTDGAMCVSIRIMQGKSRAPNGSACAVKPP
jgi:hypothetical protein